MGVSHVTEASEETGAPQPLPRRITVVGAGVSGISLGRFAAVRGVQTFVSDQKILREDQKNALAEAGIPWEEGHTPRALETDLLLLSSGISPQAPLVREARDRGIAIKGELSFLGPYLRGRLVGVTGSNGKSTTVTLLGHMLQREGRAVAVAGNVGTPLGDVADRPYDIIVMELSSFQLHWSEGLPLECGAITNLDPDHIDWHGSYESYVADKMNIFRGLSPSGAIVAQSREWASLPEGERHRVLLLGEEGDPRASLVLSPRGAILRRGHGSTALFSREDLPLLGRHNEENAAMAMALAVLLGEDPEVLRPRMATYSPLPHRCAFVARWEGVTFVDDSKGTNVAASVTALRSLEGPKVVILGGRGKGESYDSLARAVKECARWALVMGEERPRLLEALRRGEVEGVKEVSGMEEAVQEAFSRALPGDTVLLSPACTSWDAYDNYGARGDHFVALVKKEMERRQKCGCEASPATDGSSRPGS